MIILLYFTWIIAMAQAGNQGILVEESSSFYNNNNRSSCIPLRTLRDSVIQRGLGEPRKIRKISLYVTGGGTIDVSVKVATEFHDQDQLIPILKECGKYSGPVNDMLISIDCMDDEYPDGVMGWAIYAIFYGDLNNQIAVICQMDIVLHDKYAEIKAAKILGLEIFIGVLIIVCVIAAFAMMFWYWRRHRNDQPHDEVLGEDLSIDELPYFEEIQTEPQSNKPVTDARKMMSIGDDDVFLD